MTTTSPTYRLSDDQYAQIQDLLPPNGRGRRWADHRTVIDGVLFWQATGVPWRDLPERYGPWQSVFTRFRRWTQAGVWDQLFAAVQRQADAAGALDWEMHFVDGTVIRAHQHAAGAKGGTRRTKRSGAAVAGSRPKFTCAPTAAASTWSQTPAKRQRRKRVYTLSHGP